MRHNLPSVKRKISSLKLSNLNIIKKKIIIIIIIIIKS